jgi:hypothetical protein
MIAWVLMVTEPCSSNGALWLEPSAIMGSTAGCGTVPETRRLGRRAPGGIGVRAFLSGLKRGPVIKDHSLYHIYAMIAAMRQR